MRSIKVELLLAAAATAVTVCPMNARAESAATDAPASLPADTPQDSTANGAESAPAVGQQGDIIVTARRREEALSKVPVAATVLTQDMIKRGNVQSVQDLQFLAPGLLVTSSSTLQNKTKRSLQYSMRGQNDGVITLFGDAPFGNLLYVYDMENVQILRGIQGTLFGKVGGNGGAILFTPKKPGSVLEADGQIQFGNLNDFEVQGGATIPLTDALSVRIAGARVRRAGYTHVINLDQDLDSKHSDYLRVSADWRPAQWVENLFIFDSEFRNETPGSAVMVYYDPNRLTGAPAYFNPSNATYRALAPLYGWPAGGLAESLAIQSALGPRQEYANTYGSDRARTFNFINNTKFFIGNVTLTNIFEYSVSHQRRVADTTGSIFTLIDEPAIPGLSWYTSGVYQNGTTFYGGPTWSEEFRAQGSAISGKLEWLAGAVNTQNSPNNEFQIIPTVLITGAPNTSYHGQPAYLAGSGVISINAFRQRGIYGQVGYKVLPKLTLTVGGRYSMSSSDSTAVNGRFYIDPNGQAISGLVCATDLQPLAYGSTRCDGATTVSKTNGWNWAVGLDYQASDRTLLYLSSHHGFRPGNVNATAPLPIFAVQAAEGATDIEVGTKTKWTLGSIRGNLDIAAYYTFLDNAQRSVRITPQPSGLAQANVNAKSARIAGVEIDALVAPSRFFDVSASFTYTDARYSNFIIPNVNSTGTVNGTIDLSGAPFQHVPAVTANVTPRIFLARSQTVGDIILQGTWTYTGKFYTTDTPITEPQAVVPAYNLFNLRLDWTGIFHSKFDLGVFVKNVSNKAYLYNVAAGKVARGYAWATYAEPRIIGVQFGFKL